MKPKKMMEYNEYIGSIDFSLDDGLLFGKIECINDLVMYEALTLPELEVAFQEAVDDYLLTCKEVDKDPDKTFSGTFNSRVGVDRHKKLYQEKLKTGSTSINETVNNIIDSYFNASTEIHKHEHNHVHIHKVDERSSRSVDVNSWTELEAPSLRLVKH